MTTRGRGPAGAQAAPTGLGVLGGSFNPPHATHRRLCEQALQRLPIARLLVVPAGDHPHKRGPDMAPAHNRLAMCRLAFGDLPGAVVDARELHRAGPSFTVDTLAELAAEHPTSALFFLIGSDNLPLLPTWRQPERLLSLCTVVTWPRAGHAIDDALFANLPLPAAERERLRANVLALPADATAARDVRSRWRAGERELPELAPAVRDYIEAHGLYR